MQQLRERYPQSDYVDESLLEEGLAHICLQTGKLPPASMPCSKNIPIKRLPAKPACNSVCSITTTKSRQKPSPPTKASSPTTRVPRKPISPFKTSKRYMWHKTNVNSYAAYLKTLGGNVSSEISELDSLSFLTAERAFLQNRMLPRPPNSNNTSKNIPKGLIHCLRTTIWDFTITTEKNMPKPERNSTSFSNNPTVPMPKKPSPAWPTYKNGIKNTPKHL